MRRLREESQRRPPKVRKIRTNNNFNCKQKTTFNKYPVILAILVTPSLQIARKIPVTFAIYNLNVSRCRLPTCQRRFAQRGSNLEWIKQAHEDVEYLRHFQCFLENILVNHVNILINYYTVIIFIDNFYSFFTCSIGAKTPQLGSNNRCMYVRVCMYVMKRSLNLRPSQCPSLPFLFLVQNVVNL